jgi:hypothetical protein
MLVDLADGIGTPEQSSPSKSARESIGEPKTSSTGAVASDFDRRTSRSMALPRNVSWVTSMDRHEPLQHCGEVHAGRLSFKCHTNLLSLRTAFGK